MQRFLLWWEHRIATGTPRLGFRTRPQMEPSWKRRPRLHHVWGRTHLCIVLFGRNDEPSVEGGPQIVREVKEEGRELLQFRNGPDFILAGTDSGSLVRFGREENDVPSAVDQCLFQNKRSEEHTSELQSLMRISYAVFCLNKKTH